MHKLETFINRLNRIGITVELFGNYPWIYIDTINGVRVKEKFQADHGFTVAFTPQRGHEMQFTDITEIFKLIRKYTDK